MAISAAQLFPPNDGNRFYEQDAVKNQRKYTCLWNSIWRVSLAVPVALYAATVLKQGNVRSVWIDTGSRLMVPGVILSVACLAVGFIYTRYQLVALKEGPRLDDSNSFTKAAAKQFLERMEEAEKVKLVDLSALTKWKGELKAYLERQGERHYMGPEERDRVKKMLVEFETFETKLKAGGMTKADLANLVREVRGWIKENQFFMQHREKHVVISTKKKMSPELQARINGLNPDAICPELIVVEDLWCRTLNVLNTGLTALLQKVDLESDATLVNLSDELVAFRKEYRDFLGVAQTRVANRDKIRAAIVRLLQEEPTDQAIQGLGISEAKAQEWKKLAFALVKSVPIDKVEQAILELSYSFLQDL